MMTIEQEIDQRTRTFRERGLSAADALRKLFEEDRDLYERWRLSAPRADTVDVASQGAYTEDLGSRIVSEAHRLQEAEQAGDWRATLLMAEQQIAPAFVGEAAEESRESHVPPTQAAPAPDGDSDSPRVRSKRLPRRLRATDDLQRELIGASESASTTWHSTSCVRVASWPEWPAEGWFAGS